MGKVALAQYRQRLAERPLPRHPLVKAEVKRLPRWSRRGVPGCECRQCHKTAQLRTRVVAALICGVPVWEIARDQKLHPRAVLRIAREEEVQ